MDNMVRPRSRRVWATNPTPRGYGGSGTDEDAGGKSEVVWGGPTDADGHPNDFLVEDMGGICGVAVLNKANLMYNPYVDICLDVAGVRPDGSRIAADASAWEGIAIAYTCDYASSLMLGLEDSIEVAIDRANPGANLPKSTAGTFKRLQWSDFRQPSWYKGKLKIDGPTAATQLAYIAFRIEAAPGSYQFNITAIGSYNMLEHPKGGTDIQEAKSQKSVQIRSENGIVTIQGVTAGTPISLYATDGKKLGSSIADEGSATINTSLKSGSVGIIRIGDKTVKELMK